MHQTSIKCDLHSFSTRAFWSGLKKIHIILDASPYPWVFIVNWNICLKSSNTLNFDDTDVGNSVISFSIKIIPMNKQVGAWHHSDQGSKERIGFSLFMISFCEGWHDNKDCWVVPPFKDIYQSKLSRLVTFHDTIVLRRHKNVSKLVWNEMNIEKSSSINLLQNYRNMNCLKNILKRKNREILGNTQCWSCRSVFTRRREPLCGSWYPTYTCRNFLF